MSILNRSVPPSSSPSVRHTQLSETLGRVLQESTMILPNNGGKSGLPAYDPVASPEMPVEDYNSQTYEDILATAILNKVLEKCESNHIGGEVTIEVTQDSVSTDTDSGCSGGHAESRSRRAPEERNSISEGSEDSSIASPLKTAQNEQEAASSQILSRTGAASPDQGVASDDAWPDQAPLTFKIEEHVEEITTEHLTEEDNSEYEAPEYGEGTSESEGSLRGSRTSLDSRNSHNRHSRGYHSRSTRSHTRYHREESDDHRSLLPALNFTLPDNINEAIRRVSFPELGADIVGESCLNDSEEEVCPGDLVVDGDASWEENWLFQKNRLVGNRETQQDGVTMLIPNPNDTIVATVGNRDIDELSDMSEIHSVCSLSTNTSDSEMENDQIIQTPQKASKELSSLTDEIVNEFTQCDRDYTVYDSLPTHINPSNNVRVRGHMRSVEHDESNSKVVKRHIEISKPPVPKPRKISLSTSYPNKSTGNKSFLLGMSQGFGPQSITSHSTEDLSILSPPLKVPSAQDAHTSSSKTIWIVSAPENAIVNNGRALRLTCQVNAKKPMGISWYHNGKLLSGFQGGTPHSPNIWMWRHGPSHHLHIYNTDGNTAGTYAVAAYTAKHTVWAFSSVQCKSTNRVGKKPSITLGVSDHYVEDGGEVSFECQVTGHPEPRVIFYRGKDSLQPSRRVTIESDQYGTWTLRLAECTPQDSTDYQIVATNAIGHTTARLRVNVLPEGSQIPNHYKHTSEHSRSQIQHGENNQSHFTANKNTSSAHFTSKHRINDTSVNQITQSRLHTSYSDLRISKSNNDNQRNYFHMKSDDNLDGITLKQPKPGTIAEREHRKWEEAAPLANNPYAPERLASRLNGSMSSSMNILSHAGKSVEFPDDSEVDLDPSLRSLRDGVASKADLNRYSRDYYIPNKTNHTIPWKKQHHQQEKQQAKVQNHQNHQTSIQNSQNSSSTETKGAESYGGGHGNTQHIKSHHNSHTESLKTTDWKDELRDIQAAQVAGEVAKFQKTIDETTRRLEAVYCNSRKSLQSLPTYPQHQSQSYVNSHINVNLKPHRNSYASYSNEALTHCHHKRLAPGVPGPHREIWRTTSEDVIGGNSYNSTNMLRHNSMDNLQMHTTKVSNLRNVNMNHMNHVSRMNYPPSHNHIGINNHLGRSVESISGYSDAMESHGDGNESDYSTRTIDGIPSLPSVRKLASQFDLQASQERVNNLDKRGKWQEQADYYSNKNIVIIEKHQPRGTLTNNLNHGIDKPYTAKEVHSLTARSVPRKFREGLKDTRVHSNNISITLVQCPGDSPSVNRRDAPSPEHLGIPWAPAAIPLRHHTSPALGDTSDDSSAPPGSPRRVPRRRSGGRRDNATGWHSRNDFGIIKDSLRTDSNLDNV